MKDRNEGLIVAICLFFVVFLAPFNLLMALFLALALLSGYLAFRLMRERKTTKRKTAAKRKSRRK